MNVTNASSIYNSKVSLCTIICLDVDDMLIFELNMHVIHDVKSMLSVSFDMKYLRETNVILGIKTMRLKKGISLNQSHNT